MPALHATAALPVSPLPAVLRLRRRAQSVAAAFAAAERCPGASSHAAACAALRAYLRAAAPLIAG